MEYKRQCDLLTSPIRCARPSSTRTSQIGLALIGNTWAYYAAATFRKRMSFIAWANSHCDFQTSQIDAGDIAPAALEVAGVRPAGMRIISYHFTWDLTMSFKCCARLFHGHSPTSRKALTSRRYAGPDARFQSFSSLRDAPEKQGPRRARMGLGAACGSRRSACGGHVAGILVGQSPATIRVHSRLGV